MKYTVFHENFYSFTYHLQSDNRAIISFTLTLIVYATQIQQIQVLFIFTSLMHFAPFRFLDSVLKVLYYKKTIFYIILNKFCTHISMFCECNRHDILVTVSAKLIYSTLR